MPKKKKQGKTNKTSVKKRILLYHDMDTISVMEAVAGGDPAAMVALGDWHLDGTRGIVQDFYAAGKWYDEAKQIDPQIKAFMRGKNRVPRNGKPMLWFEGNYISMQDVSLMMWEKLERPPEGMEAVHIAKHSSRRDDICIFPEHLEWRPKEVRQEKT
jgi:TPR repeat protein